ncbi:MAG: hypothetical protein Q8P48_10555 [Deltaproteobacteria bacterium]|nr:hypothetical protein [Deltaproteobacteria bacterium]
MDLKSCKKVFKRGLQLGLAALLLSGFVPMKATAEQTVDAGYESQETGDANIGREYFQGTRRFSNGGPPCISCHSAGVGQLGGGVLGPNLTKVYADESKNPLVSGAWINGGGSPVMGPVFGNRNITDDEVNHLRAFFEQQSHQGTVSSHTGAFTIIGIGGTVGILIIFNIIWSGRYRNRNRGTAHDALWRNYGGKGGR